MRKEWIVTGLVSSLLAFALAWGGAMCLVTGFRLPVEDPAGMLRWCLVCSVAGSLLLLIPWGGRIYALLTALLAGYLWQLGSPLEQLLDLVQTISLRYDSAYGWGFFSFSDASRSGDYPLWMLVYLQAGLAEWCVCRGKGCLPAVLAAAFPVAACFVVTDTVPQAPFLFLSMGGVAVLVISNAVRRQSSCQGARLAAMAVLPVLAALALLFWLVPQDRYVDRSDRIRSSVFSWAERMARGVESAVVQLTAGPQRAPGDVDLAGLGPQDPSSYPVMEVRADTTGALYLRAWDCDTYTGTGWQCSPDRQELFSASPEAGSGIEISVENALEYRFVPYYPLESIPLTGGRVPNPEGSREYAYVTGAYAQGGEGLADGDRHRYLALPSQTREGARRVLTQLGAGASTQETAESIGAFVRSCAGYDLTPDRMPKDRRDFALWFLEEADRGYCIHFATAAVVLLRAAEIPARYVTGYLVQTEAGQLVTVTRKEAHAWAEYYDAHLGSWQILEATPPDPRSANTAAPDPAPEEPEETAAPDPGSLPDTAPSLSTGIPESAEATGRNRPVLAWVTGTVAAGVLLVEAQRLLRRLLRRWRQRRGSSRQRSLALWWEAALLCRLLGEQPREELVEIAQKAKFSHREPEAEELEYMERVLDDCRKHLGQQTWRKRLVCRYLYAAY